MSPDPGGLLTPPERAAPGPDRGSHATRVALLALFFLSGACGLVYEVVWMRELTLVFGTTAFATSTILAAFFSGLALGGFLFGRVADRRGDPLRVYAVLETGIGVFAFLMPWLLAGVTDVYVDIARRWSIGYYAINGVRFALSFLVLLVPATLMGGTLPVLVKYFAREPARVGRDIGRLYAVNTAGAVVGTFLAGFLLILLIGVHETAWLAGAVNLLVAAMVWTLARRDRGPAASAHAATASAARAPETSPASARSARLALWAAGVSGFCALALEVLWTRSLVYFLDNSTHAFSTILTAFLIGIALGSALVSRWLDASRGLLTALGVLQLLVGASALLAMPILNRTVPVLQRMSDVTPDALLYWHWTAIRFLTSLSVMLVPTVLMGMAFPLAARIHARRVEAVGTSLGNVYSLNTFAGVVGSVATGFLIVPAIGVRGGILLVAVVSVALGAVLVLADPTTSRAGRIRALGSSGLVAAAAGVLWLSIGRAPLASYIERMDTHEVLAYDEDVGATVKVFADSLGQRYVSIDGFPVAGTSLGLLDAQKSLSALPMLLTPVDSPRVNIIGFGAGGTSWGILQYGVEHIDCVELVPAVLKAARWFPDVNHGVIEEPRYHVTRGDGRNHALVSDRTYDVVSIDATSPKMAGNGSLYTREFYTLLDARLSDRGLVAQWLPFHLLSDAEMRMTARTFQAVFPHATLWFSPIRHHAVLIGTREPLRIDVARLERRLRMDGVRAELAPLHVSSALDVLGWYAMGEDALRDYTEGARLNTDNHPYLEFAPAMAYFVSRSYLVRNLLTLRDRRESPLPLLADTGATGEERAAFAVAVERRFEATQESIAGDAYSLAGRTDAALRAYGRALAIDPRDKNWLHPAWANVTRSPR